jgi:predicted RNA-binding protein associated with RNAse of E/G family
VTTFEPGQTVVARDSIHGKLYSAWPYRVVADDGHELALLLRPGTSGIGPALWIQATRDNDAAARHALMPAIAKGEWELGDWTWRSTTRLTFAYPDRFYAIAPMWNRHGDLSCWYVNFQMPYRRTEIGIDTWDLEIDLVVRPDFTYQWKDQDEYDHARRLGVIGDRCHRQVEAAREQALAQVQQRTGVFAQPWDAWRPEPDWPIPTLPHNALTEPIAPGLVCPTIS